VPGLDLDLDLDLVKAAEDAWHGRSEGHSGDKDPELAAALAATLAAAPVQYQYQYQLPPTDLARPRTLRQPPRAKAAPLKAKTKATQRTTITAEAPEPAEEAAPEEQETQAMLTKEGVKTRLQSIGVCPQSFKWSRRTSMDEDCQKCGGKNTVVGSGRRAGGFQCEGGSHWVCMGCIMPTRSTPSPKPEYFD
jgi:hypothetical protein